MSAKVTLWAVVLLMFAVAVSADPPPPQGADPISIDQVSPSIAFGNTPADIYGEAGGMTGMGWDVAGGIGPILHIPDFNYGLTPLDENDGHSRGHNDPYAIPIVYFSADRWSLGLWATQYRHQAIRNQAAGDRFVTNGWMNIPPAVSYASGAVATLVVWMPGWGPNLLSANQTRYNEIPSIPQWVVNSTSDPWQIDDMDALELHAFDFDRDFKHDVPIFFSLDAGSPSLPVGSTPADIFISWPGAAAFSQWATAASMGLQSVDDIDALVVFHVSGNETAVAGVDYALFSLRPGNSLNADASDVFVTCFQGMSTLYFVGATVGLRKHDDLDGLDIEVWDASVTPQIWDEIEEDPVPPMMTIPQGRAQPDGSTVNVSGIVTLIGPTYLYIEAPDRSSGIRVEMAPSSPPGYVAVGDDLQVVGIIGLFDGERAIFPTQPVSPISSGNPLPGLLGMRTRDVGGNGYDALNPGITNGRGPLNVGLLVKLSGMVTAVDPNPAPQWFYIWDGANKVDTPVDDGTGNWGVRIMSTLPVTSWVDWIEVTGVVSTDATSLPGSVIPEILPTQPPTIVTSFNTLASPAGTVIAGYNLVGVPAAPAGTGTGSAWALNPWEASQIFPPLKTQAEIDYILFRWESTNQSMYVYDMLGEPNGPFGGVLLGDGYWLNAPSAWTVSYSCRLDTIDQWVAPGQGNWMLLAHPQNSDTNWEFGGSEMHSGNQVRGIVNASQYGVGWIWSVGFYWDNATSSLLDIGFSGDLPSDDTLRVWRGYWFQFIQDDKALIIP